MGIKCGYSSPQTLTDQSTAIKHGEKGDLQVLRPHLMTCVPVGILFFFFLIFYFSFEFFLKTILDRIHKTINEKINQSNFFNRQLFNLAYTIKVKRLESGLDSPHLDR
jgi:long-chain acyl-CoA synthetase